MAYENRVYLHTQHILTFSPTLFTFSETSHCSPKQKQHSYIWNTDPLFSERKKTTINGSFYIYIHLADY